MSKVAELLNYVQNKRDETEMGIFARDLYDLLDTGEIPGNKKQATYLREQALELKDMLKAAYSAACEMLDLRERQLLDEMLAEDEQSFTSSAFNKTFFMRSETRVASAIKNEDGKRSYNDDELVAWLAEHGGEHLAKRTVNAQSFGAFVRELMLHPDSTKANPIYDESLLPAGWERFVEIQREPAIGTRKV